MALGNGAEMRNVMALTSKQRAYLGGCASTMDPIFHIGKASLTPEIITALDEALEKREKELEELIDVLIEVRK